MQCTALLICAPLSTYSSFPTPFPSKNKRRKSPVKISAVAFDSPTPPLPNLPPSELSEPAAATVRNFRTETPEPVAPVGHNENFRTVDTFLSQFSSNYADGLREIVAPSLKSQKGEANTGPEFRNSALLAPGESSEESVGNPGETKNSVPEFFVALQTNEIESSDSLLSEQSKETIEEIMKKYAKNTPAAASREENEGEVVVAASQSATRFQSDSVILRQPAEAPKVDAELSAFKEPAAFLSGAGSSDSSLAEVLRRALESSLAQEEESKESENLSFSESAKEDSNDSSSPDRSGANSDIFSSAPFSLFKSLPSFTAPPPVSKMSENSDAKNILLPSNNGATRMDRAIISRSDAEEEEAFSFVRDLTRVYLQQIRKSGEALLRSAGQKLEDDFPSLSPGSSAFRTLADRLADFGELPPDDQAQLLALVTAAATYLSVRPGVLQGAVDAYVFAPLQSAVDIVRGRRNLQRKDFVVGSLLGEGNFGTVYEGGLKLRRSSNDEEEEEGRGRARRTRVAPDTSDSSAFKKVILKKVKTRAYGAIESGEMEEWFNLRLQRVAPAVCAKYVGSFVADSNAGQFTEGGKWLVWDYEGDSTLYDYMLSRDFPDNLEDRVFGSGRVLLRNLDSKARHAVIIKQIMRQTLISLQKIHDTGIVHRDIKPANLVITNQGRVKLIDFGAATDLRIGMNYTPDVAMLDPDYCPPEQYVMPEETPAPPPAPLAALASPILWQLNKPDLFDCYSAGIILLQMACPNLRTKGQLQLFKNELRAARYDLKRWLKESRMRVNISLLLDLQGGLGFDLASKLVCERRGGVGGTGGRLSAAAALRHPYLLLSVDQAATAFSKLTFSR